MMRVFWWNTVPNIGDTFTRLLLERHGVPVEWSGVAQAEVVGVGSVLEWFTDRGTTIIGTGRAGSSAPRTDLSRATVLALRGQETVKLTNVEPQVLGDLGLLVGDLCPRWEGGYTAVVPHWQDQDRLRHAYPDARFVDVMGPPSLVLRDIAGAERIVASSLHGLVFADAYGIPRMWDPFKGTQGRGFKFADYMSTVGFTDPLEWDSAPQTTVESLKGGLRECLAKLLSA